MERDPYKQVYYDLMPEAEIYLAEARAQGKSIDEVFSDLGLDPHGLEVAAVVYRFLQRRIHDDESGRLTKGRGAGDPVVVSLPKRSRRKG